MTNQANEQAAPKEPPSKGKAVLMFIYTIIMIFYTIFGLVQAITAYMKFRDLSKGLNNIVKNWKQNIITGITLAPANAACPVGRANEFQFTFGGSDMGCDCEGTNNAQFSPVITPRATCNST
jgi:hypothetical protein